MPEGGGGFKGFERGKLLLFSQWLVVVYKLNSSQSCKNRIMIMQQGKGLCFQSSSTQVSANDLGASTLLAESLRSFLDDLSRKIEEDSACGVGGK